MPNKSAAYADALLRYTFHGVPLPPAGPLLYLSLHAADPSGGDQATAEAAYGGYARVPVPRAAGAWDVAGYGATLRAEAFFPPASGPGRVVLTHWGVGTEPEGPGCLLRCDELAEPVEVSRPVQPYLPAGAITVSEG